MASGYGQFLERHLLDLVWGAQGYTSSGTVYVGLATATINPTDTGITVVEPSTTNTAYARVAVTNNLTQFPAATSAGPASKQNANTITFPTATGAWGTVTYFFFSDGSAVGTGSILGYGSLTTSKTISSGDSSSFAANAITITLS